MDYVALEGGRAHLGTGIVTEVFPFTGPNGEELWCMYWEPQAGVILYAWGETLEQMQEDAAKALGGAAALAVLFKIYKSSESVFAGGFGVGAGAFGRGGRQNGEMVYTCNSFN